MVAVRNDLVQSVGLRPFNDAALTGEWVLDRVSGLIDCAMAAIQRLRIDAHALHIELKSRHDAAFRLRAELNGEATELQVAGEIYCAQALLEGAALIWEIEHQTAHGCARIRRVMRLSAQGSELIGERVDLNPEGVPVALRTEYWTRAGRIDDGA